MGSTPLSPTIFRMKKFYIILCFLSLSFFAYFNSLNNSFLLDDHILIFGSNGLIHKSFIELLTSAAGDFYYRPVGNIPLWVAAQLFQANVVYYHFLNLVLFSLVCSLIYFVTLKLSSNQTLSLITAIFYCVHPINNIYVNYVTASLFAVYVATLLLSLLSFIKYLETKNFWQLFLSIVFFGCGLFSHEGSVIFVVFLWAYLYFFESKEKLRKESLILAPYVLMMILFFALRSFLLKANSTLGISHLTGHFKESALSLADLIGWYLSKLIYPNDILFIYNTSVVFEGVWIDVVALIVLLMVCLWLIFIRWKKGFKPFAFFVFLVGFAPLSVSAFAYFPSVKPMIAPYWFYFSSIGFFWVFAAGIVSMTKHYRIRRIIITMMIGGFLLSHLWMANQKWKNQETYCRYWLSQNRLNLTPYYGLGRSLLEQEEFREAKFYFREGIQTTQIYNPMILADLGLAELNLKNYDNAAHYFKKVLELDPGFAQNHFYLSQYFHTMRDHHNALAAIDRAIALYPENKMYKKFKEEMSK